MAFNTHLITPSTTSADYERLFPSHASVQQGSRKFPLPHIDKAIQINNLALVDFFFTQAPQLLNVHDKSNNKTFLSKAFTAYHLPLTERLNLTERLIVLGADVNIPIAIGRDKSSSLLQAIYHDILQAIHHDIYGSSTVINIYENLAVMWTRLLCYYGYSFTSRLSLKQPYLNLHSILKKVFRSLYIEIISFQRALADHSPLPSSVTQISVNYLWQSVYDYRHFTDDIATSALAECMHEETTPKAFEEMRSLLPHHRFEDKDDQGYTVLHHAIDKNNPSLIKHILKKEPQLLQKPAKEGVTLLSYAIQVTGHRPEGARIPKLLLELGADAHAPSLSFVGKKIVPLFFTALASDIQTRGTPITQMDVAARSCTHLLLREGYHAGLTDSDALPSRVLAQLGTSSPDTPDFDKKVEKIHVFLKMVFAELGREFARERTSLLTLLEGTQLICKDTPGIVVDYVYPPNWDHIPGATNYLK